MENFHYDRSLKKYTANWKKIGGPGKKFVYDNKFLYRLSLDGNMVETNQAHIWSTSTNTSNITKWEWIRKEPTADIYAGPTGLIIKPSFKTIGDTKFYRYPNWKEYRGGEMLIGGPCKDKPLAVGGIAGEEFQLIRHLIGIESNSLQVWKYNFNPNKPYSWTCLGGPGPDSKADKIYAGGSRFYATHQGTGDIYLYKQANVWEKIGGPGFMFAVENVSGEIYRLSPLKDKIEMWTGQPGVWIQIGNNARAIFAGKRKHLAAINSQNELLLCKM